MRKCLSPHYSYFLSVDLFVGSPYWIAPEVITLPYQRAYTNRVDIWSLGITALELAQVWRLFLFFVFHLRAVTCVCRFYICLIVHGKLEYTFRFFVVPYHALVCIALFFIFSLIIFSLFLCLLQKTPLDKATAAILLLCFFLS